MTRIEYKTVAMTHGTMGVHKGKIHRIQFENALREEGEAGWDLVWVMQDASLHQEKDAHLLVFKRVTS